MANNARVQNIRNHYVGDVVHRGHNTLIIGAIYMPSWSHRNSMWTETRKHIQPKKIKIIHNLLMSPSHVSGRGQLCTGMLLP